MASDLSRPRWTCAGRRNLARQGAPPRAVAEAWEKIGKSVRETEIYYFVQLALVPVAGEFLRRRRGRADRAGGPGNWENREANMGDRYQPDFERPALQERFARHMRGCLAALLALASWSAPADASITTKCESAPLMAAFTVFSETGRMPPDLAKFLADAALQKIEPYKAFDNVYYVGICWVSAWLLTSPKGHILIDTLYGAYTDDLIANVRAVGFDPKDIKLVVVTHGHFDHAGGIAKLRAALDPSARFALTNVGWQEGVVAAASGRPAPWNMIEPDITLTDGQTLEVGDNAIQAFETPGHTMGTASFVFAARDGTRSYRAITVGGLGLNAIKGPEQVEAYIASVKRIRAMTEERERPVELHLTTHGFSTGLPEARERLRARKAGDPHPLVVPAGFRAQLDLLQDGAEKRLVLERAKAAK